MQNILSLQYKQIEYKWYITSGEPYSIIDERKSEIKKEKVPYLQNLWTWSQTGQCNSRLPITISLMNRDMHRIYKFSCIIYWIKSIENIWEKAHQKWEMNHLSLPISTHKFWIEVNQQYFKYKYILRFIYTHYNVDF